MRKINLIAERFYSSRTNETKEYETINVQEMLNIRDSIHIDENKTSVLNTNLTKEQAYNILFNSGSLEINDPIHYLQFRNIIREFILKQKTFNDRYKNIECVKV